MFTQIWQQLNLELDKKSTYDRLRDVIHSHLVLPEAYTSGQSSSLCHDWHSRGIMQAKSQEEALQVWDAFSRLPFCGCKNLIQNKGILMGGKHKKRFMLSNSQKLSVMEFYNRTRSSSIEFENVHSNGFFFTKVLFDQEKYEVGNFVATKGSRHRGCIEKIFCHEQGRQIQVFVEIECILNEFQTLDQVTGMPLLHKSERTNVITKVLPIKSLSHKFFWLEAPSQEFQIAYDTSNRMVRSRLLLPGEPGCVPPWLEEGDVVLAINETSQQREALVIQVDIDNKKALLSWLSSYEDSIQWIEWTHILSLVTNNTQ